MRLTIATLLFYSAVTSSTAVTAATANIQDATTTGTTAVLNDPTQPTEAAYLNEDNEDDYSSEYGDYSGIKIDGIIFSKQRKAAIINGKFLGAGDKIGELTLIDIYPDAVLVKNPSNEVIIVKTYPSDIKTQSSGEVYVKTVQ